MVVAVATQGGTAAPRVMAATAPRVVVGPVDGPVVTDKGERAAVGHPVSPVVLVARVACSQGPEESAATVALR